MCNIYVSVEVLACFCIEELQESRHLKTGERQEIMDSAS
jgi:hypothetical protein